MYYFLLASAALSAGQLFSILPLSLCSWMNQFYLVKGASGVCECRVSFWNGHRHCQHGAPSLFQADLDLMVFQIRHRKKLLYYLFGSLRIKLKATLWISSLIIKIMHHVTYISLSIAKKRRAPLKGFGHPLFPGWGESLEDAGVSTSSARPSMPSALGQWAGFAQIIPQLPKSNCDVSENCSQVSNMKHSSGLRLQDKIISK